MSIITLEAAKAHLRVDGTDEDALIEVYLDAAEQSSIDYIERNLYETAGDLEDAIAAVPDAMAAATEAYEAAVTAAEAIEDDVERALALRRADRVYADAQTAAARTYDGLVMTQAIRSAVLLLVGHLYQNRSAVVDAGRAQVAEAPLAVRWLLDPHRSNLGV